FEQMLAKHLEPIKSKVEKIEHVVRNLPNQMSIPPNEKESKKRSYVQDKPIEQPKRFRPVNSIQTAINGDSDSKEIQHHQTVNEKTEKDRPANDNAIIEHPIFKNGLRVLERNLNLKQVISNIR